MATNNRRVATYLPAHLDEAFNQFKSEHQLGDSQAVLEILTRYLGVAQEETHLGDSPKVEQRLIDLEQRVSSLKSELLGELLGELNRWKDSVDTRLINLESSSPSSSLAFPHHLMLPSEKEEDTESVGTQVQNAYAPPDATPQQKTRKNAHLNPIPAGLQCPKCSSSDIGRYGSFPDGQRKYRCKNCGRQFKSLENLPVESTPKPRSGRSVAKRVDGQKNR